jgi:hypothetical protein
MNDFKSDIDGHFFQLVLSLQVAAMQQMGKIASPISGKIERNLDQAKASIDMLAMLAEKTAGNLSKDEKDLIDRVLYEARLNYIDESKKGDNPDEKKSETEDKTSETAGDTSSSQKESEASEEISETKSGEDNK